MAAELTSMVPAMAQEWIGILQAIMPKGDTVSKTYSDVLTRIDTGNILTAEQLAVLYGIMIARNTIRLSDVVHTVLQCLHKTNGHQNDPNRDPARDKDLRKIQRICSAFLLVILRSHPPKDFLTQYADRYLLRAAQIGLDLRTMVASLRMLMLVAADSMLSNMGNTEKFMSLNVPVDSYASLDSGYFLRNAPRDISEFAHKIIKVICSDGWVKEKCLRNIEQLVGQQLLNMKSEQSHCILQLICYPEPGMPEEAEPKDQEAYIEGILRNLQIWTQRQSRLQLLFLFKYSDKIDTDKVVTTHSIGKVFRKYILKN